VIPSVFIDEQECIMSLIAMHSPNGIELDPMFYKGNFYKKIDRPRLIFDINPQHDYVEKADAANLPIDNNSIDCMILDPPFMFGNHGKTKEYYSSKTHGIFDTFDDLEKLYKSILVESYRILKDNGILFFKCQDYTDNKTTLTHCFVWEWSRDIGFYAKDLAILHLPKNKIYNSGLQQRHTRKVHSYFFVLQRRRK